MGSHGGATAEGQRQVLESYGISEAAVGCPIRASMETTIVGRAAEGFPLHIDRAACAADHVLVCGRVKPHTAFAGDIQSGLLKMLLIGLGKQSGANIYHRASKTTASTTSCGSRPPRSCRSAASWRDWRSWKTPTTKRP